MMGGQGSGRPKGSRNRNRLTPKLWRIVRRDGSAQTFEDEATMQSHGATDQEVTVGVYRLIEQYVAVKTMVFARKTGSH